MLNNILQWSATVFTVLGALATVNNEFGMAVIVFNIGSILWLLFAIRIKSKSLISVNALMLLIYGFGALKAAI